MQGHLFTYNDSVLTHIVLLNINRQSQSSYACQMDYLGGICEKRKSFAVHEELVNHHDLRSRRYLLLSLGRCKELPNPRHRENPAVVQLFISWLCGTVVGLFQHSSLWRDYLVILVRIYTTTEKWCEIPTVMMHIQINGTREMQVRETGHDLTWLAVHELGNSHFLR